MRLRNVLIIAAAALVLSACGSSGTITTDTNATAVPAAARVTVGSIQISDPWARAAAMGGKGEAQPTSAAMGIQPTGVTMEGMQPPGAAMGDMGGANGAVYMTIRNTGSAPDKLIKAESDAAKTIELHTVIQSGDVMQMRPVAAIDVPAAGETALKPGGFHVMLIGLTRDLKPGDHVAVKLMFAQAGTVDVQAEVRQ